MKKGSVVPILRVLTKRGGDDEKPQVYPLRYVEDFFGVSNEVAVKLSKCATGNHFSRPVRATVPITPVTLASDACFASPEGQFNKESREDLHPLSALAALFVKIHRRILDKIPSTLRKMYARFLHTETERLILMPASLTQTASRYPLIADHTILGSLAKDGSRSNSRSFFASSADVLLDENQAGLGRTRNGPSNIIFSGRSNM